MKITTKQHLFLVLLCGVAVGVENPSTERTAADRGGSRSLEGEAEGEQPPDDQQSTTRIRNETADPAKNTVPILRWASPTEASLKDKYRRTTEKSFKGRRNVTRTRPSELTTLLAYNGLTPSPAEPVSGPTAARPLGKITRARPAKLAYLTTTQVAESIPPTAWALASLKGPPDNPESTKPPAINSIKPFVSWSTRLVKTTLQPQLQDITELVTGPDEPLVGTPDEPLAATTETEMSALPETRAGPDASSAEPAIVTTMQPSSTTTARIHLNETRASATVHNTTTPELASHKPPVLTSVKPDENTIAVSASPLSLIKNKTEINNISGDIYEIFPESSNRNLDFLSNSSSQSKFGPMEIREMPNINDTLTEPLNATSSSSAEDLVKPIESTSIPTEIVEHSVEKSTEHSFNIQEIDPLINSITEKRHEYLSTSTVASILNSSTMGVPLATPFNSKKTEDEINSDVVRTVPLLIDVSTSASITHSTVPSSTVNTSQLHDDINQTSNDIKVVDQLKPSFQSKTEIGTGDATKEQLKPSFQSKVKIETGDTSKSNDIKLQEAHLSGITDNNTDPIIVEIPETTQSNDIQVQERLHPHNKTVIPRYSVDSISVTSSEDTSKEIAHTMPAPQKNTTVHSTSTARTVTNSSSVNPTKIVYTLPSTLYPTTFLPPIAAEETTVLSENKTVTTLRSQANVTSLLLNTTSEKVATTPSINLTIIETTSDKSNEIKHEETTTAIHPLTPRMNETIVQDEFSFSLKNDTSAFREPEDVEVDEETGVSFNQTDLSDKKSSGGAESVAEEDSGDDEVGVSVVSSTERVNVSSVTLSTQTVRSTSPEVRPALEEEPVTHLVEEEHTSLYDDTVYDTGVVIPVYIVLHVQATYNDVCRDKELLKDAIVRAFKSALTRKQVMYMNVEDICSMGREESLPEGGAVLVRLYLIDQAGRYDKALTEQLLSIGRITFTHPISHMEAQSVASQDNEMEPEPPVSATLVAAIVISSIAAVCLLALTVLLVIMRKRQKGFNYGQRCTPVSLDDYSLDNISVYNSQRRKAMRASKRSYGNPAFHDPDVTSNPVNFAGLANMAADRARTDEEFSGLPQVTVRPDELPPGCESKNRYANVIPLPETRIHLRGVHEGFINANYVKGSKEDKFYIACQAPLQETIQDFWQMVWDEQSRLIIMLTALSENGVEKCADYLPPSEVLDCHRVFGDLQVTLKNREAREKYVISSLQLKNLDTNLWREVTHMWFAGWPPTGVPAEPSSVIAFLIEARSYQAKRPGAAGPVVVHCSPGTGRTGTLIAVDLAIREFEAGRTVDIPRTVAQVRRGRAGAVQTKEQYAFIYKVLHLYATKLTGGGLDSI